MTTKDRIISEIKWTASENGGKPLGQRSFADATAIAVPGWRGKFWGTWSEALAEAGFAANVPKERHKTDALLASLIALARKLKRFPTYADVRMARQGDPTFPSHQSINKLGSRLARIELVRAATASNPAYRDVLDLLPVADGSEAEPGPTDGTLAEGSVYMMKLGKHYKIGNTCSVPRRHREVGIELPEQPDVVHVITTDDAYGIEAYWHKRFNAKRTNGEWFALSREEVQAFKRRKFM